jgi:peroxiredoxin
VLSTLGVPFPKTPITVYADGITSVIASMRAASIKLRPRRRIGANKRMTFAFDRDGSVLAVIKSAFNMRGHADKGSVVLTSRSR